MYLSIADWSDFIGIQEIVAKFHTESPYAHIPLKHAKVNEIILSFIENKSDRTCILLKDGNKVVGIIAGQITEPVFCDRKIAHEIVWYVLPDYRKSIWSIKLLKAFEYWSENVMKADITQMASVSNDHIDKLQSLYEKRGYKLFEKTYLKEKGNGRS